MATRKVHVDMTESKGGQLSVKIQSLVKDVNKALGSVAVASASDATALSEIRRVSLGIPGVDIPFGGGFPVGRYVIIKGHPSSGKGIIASKYAAAFQRTCRNCYNPMIRWNDQLMIGTKVPCCNDPQPCSVAWIDAEAAWENAWALKFAINLDTVLIVRCETAEQAIDVVDEFNRCGLVDLIVIDSIANMTPHAEIEAASGEFKPGLQARLVNQAMRKWVSGSTKDSLVNMKCSVLAINQIRMKIGVMYGSPETAPGGMGAEFGASIVAKIKKVKQFETSRGHTFAQTIGVKCTKNKTSQPNRAGEFTFFFNKGKSVALHGTDLSVQIVRYAADWNLIEKSGAWYRFADNGEKYQGEKAAASALSAPSMEKMRQFLFDEIMKREVAAWGGGDMGSDLSDVM